MPYKKPSVAHIILAIVGSFLFTFLVYVGLMGMLSFLDDDFFNSKTRDIIALLVTFMWIFGPTLFAALIIWVILRLKKQ